MKRRSCFQCNGSRTLPIVSRISTRTQLPTMNPVLRVRGHISYQINYSSVNLNMANMMCTLKQSKDFKVLPLTFGIVSHVRFKSLFYINQFPYILDLCERLQPSSFQDSGPSHVSLSMSSVFVSTADSTCPHPSSPRIKELASPQQQSGKLSFFRFDPKRLRLQRLVTGNIKRNIQ